MKLNNPIKINIQGTDIILEDLDLLIIDDTKHKKVVVKIHPLAKPLLVWKQEDYDAAGDYTQAQLEAKILEILGPDQQKGLQSLFNIEIL